MTVHALRQDDEPLPRQTYMTPEHAANELRIAELVAPAWGATQVKIGKDIEGKQKPKFDRAFIRDGAILRMAEIKKRNCLCFSKHLKEGYTISEKKVIIGRQLHRFLCIPILLIQEWSDGKLTCVDTKHPYIIKPNWGRTDRNDPADLETGACFEWKYLKRIRAGNVT